MDPIISNICSLDTKCRTAPTLSNATYDVGTLSTSEGKGEGDGEEKEKESLSNEEILSAYHPRS